ncbi:MAG: AhpC/TSA family protein [Kangiellaceae bacterium]|nr:AhpC/TSA family protein [Kangiellaceae bacterium]
MNTKLFKFLLFTVSLCSFQSLANDIPIKNTIATDANLVSPLLIGQQIPDVTLWTPQGKPFALKDAVARKPTILLFYRGGWCPFCNAQLSQIQMIEKDLSQLGYQLLAISPDTPDALQMTSRDKDLSYQLISDFQLAASIGFGLAFNISDEYAEKMRGVGGTPVRALGDDKSTLPVPAVFIVDQKGIIQFEYINPNYKVRIEPELLLTAAKITINKQQDM